MAKKKGGSKSNTFKIGRDAKTGQFISQKEAKRRPSTTIVETISKNGKGTNSGGPRKK